MGKAEEEHQPLPQSEDPPQNAETECRCSRIRKLVGLRCILVLVLSVAVFLSALFWLPPFLRLADRKNLNADYNGHDIVASFNLNKSVSLLKENSFQLADEIFDEIDVLSTKVVILSLDPLPGPNKTRVVFAVDSDDENTEMSSAATSLIKASFTSLVIHQSILQLTSSSLFGDPFFFEVLKFKGGITIILPQNAFPLQKVQTLFSFKLNFPIYQIQSNFNELTTQLKSGLHLASFENLHVSLSNSEGSTVDSPTVVQTSVLLAVGIPPSKERLKQLAQTIMGPHNLGLNNTEFGRVKQVRLSSILQHSLHGSDGTWSPSPAPMPHPSYHHHHHQHRHHHHHHHHDAHLTPATSPVPVPALAPTPISSPEEGITPPKVVSPATTKRAPSPGKNSQAQPPNCHFGYRKRSTHHAGKHAHLTPVVAPSIDPHYPVPVASPKSQVESPAHVPHSVPALSPLPNVAFAHAEPPPKNEPAAERSHIPSRGPPLSSCCLGTVKWTYLFIVLVLRV
ncbi:inactive histone-lysine N-methyltransferase 2E-like isoform X2 [Abrus precatorius]|uniref:Inactive histone-lysine N-methyltransferase 2E-like isoform X2 n=1 Tax=Abrus precatorius TaxID=3816 RepID=A0A8B8L096_ABRPR|nr:inactive histone-lysine N-methyltransferase 2E-like isoform X2 [Abrus precatorius]